MKKIIVATKFEFYPDQQERLAKLGDVKFYDGQSATTDEWLERCKGADIICTNTFGFKERVYELKDVFIVFPFVGVGFLDKEKLKTRNITVANCPGGNKYAVSEWIIGMMINLFRKLPSFINIKDINSYAISYKAGVGLFGKKICILGKGNIGNQVGKVCEALGIQVSYYLRGDDLSTKIKEVDCIVNCLSHNPDTENLLDKKFFSSLKPNSYYITISSPKIHDKTALFEALDKGILAGAAFDVGNVDDPNYQELINHPKIMSTPHVAAKTDVTARISYDMMIDNVEAWIKGKLINLI